MDTRERDNEAFARTELKAFAVLVTPEGHAPYAIKSMEQTRLGHLVVRIYVCVCVYVLTQCTTQDLEVHIYVYVCIYVLI